MKNRRTFLRLATASLLPVGLEAQTAGPRPPVELARHALTGPLDGFEAVLVELSPAPGSRSPAPGHRHPGPVLGYVVEGQMRFAIDNGPEQVLPVGSTFFEQTGALHSTNGSARTDGPTRAGVHGRAEGQPAYRSRVIGPGSAIANRRAMMHV